MNSFIHFCNKVFCFHKSSDQDSKENSNKENEDIEIASNDVTQSGVLNSALDDKNEEEIDNETVITNQIGVTHENKKIISDNNTNKQSKNTTKQICTISTTNNYDVTPTTITNNISKNITNNNKNDLSETSDQLLFLSALGDKDHIIKLLGKKPSSKINSKDSQGRTALTHSILGGHQATTDLLLSHHADPDIQDSTGRSALHWAVIKGNVKVAHRLASRGADVCLGDATASTPLHLASKHHLPSLLPTLLKYATSLDHQDSHKRTALHLACSRGNSEHVTLLLRHDSNVAIPDEKGYTPLHYAVSCASGNPVACIGALLEAYPSVINWQDYEGCTALHRSLPTRNVDIVQTLLSAKDCNASAMDNHFRTPLHWSVALDNAQLSSLLLDYKADLSSSDCHGGTPLHYAAQYNSAETVRVLLRDAGSKDDELDLEGRTAFLWACCYGADDVIRCLVGMEKTDVMVVDKAGASALHMAASAGHVTTVDLLLDMGIPVDLQDNSNLNPLSLACQAGHVEVVMELVSKGASVVSCDQDGCTPIHWAALGGHERVCELLLECGVCVHDVDYSGRTSLHCSSWAGNTACLLLLLDHHSDVNALDKEGKTSLHWACIKGHLPVIKQLLKHQALINVRDLTEEKYTCLDYSLMHAHKEVSIFLMEKGALSITGIEEESALKIQSWYRMVRIRRVFVAERQLLIRHEALKRIKAEESESKLKETSVPVPS